MNEEKIAFLLKKWIPPLTQSDVEQISSEIMGELQREKADSKSRKLTGKPKDELGKPKKR